MSTANREADNVDSRPSQRVDRRRLLAAQAAAARFYRAQLGTDEGAGPSRFLARIGVPRDGPWVVGFAPDRPTAVVNELRRRGFSDLEIRASGLARTGHRRQLVDRFRNRVMVGIRDGPDREAPVVGFVGYAPPRAGPDVPACLYSPGSTIYRPQSTLFGVGEQQERAGGSPVVAAHPLDAIAVSARTASSESPPLVVAPAGQRLTRRHVDVLGEVSDLSAGVGVTLRTDDDGRRAAEDAYRRLAPVVGARNVLVASWSTGLENTRSLGEALAVGRVDQAAEAQTTDAARAAATRAAADLVTEQDPEVGSRLRRYMARRLGADQAPEGPEQLPLDFTGPETAPPAPQRPTTAPKPPATPTEPQAARPPQEPHPPTDAGAAGRDRPEPPEAGAADRDRPERTEAGGARRDRPEPPPAQERETRDPEAPPERDEATEPSDPLELESQRFRPTAQQDLAPSGERARVRANLDALRALKRQLDEERAATPDEQTLYARWSGWGAIAVVFDDRPGVGERYAAEREELRQLLDENEYRAARRTTLNAHYTDAAYAEAIWKALGELGFGGGRVLEPGCGSGNFIGFAPEGAFTVGVELDPTTAAMAQALYPDAQIRAESFAETSVADGTFDVAVGNVPFGDYSLRDPQHNPARRHSIHNHFILKSLRFTRPGGVVALITSHYTMDGQDDAHQAARAEMAELADLLGAVRLPTDAHSTAAGTKVVTDLVILRRRDGGPTKHAGAWQQLRSQEFPGARDQVAPASFDVNEYFLDHPEMVLGETLTDSGRFGPELAVRGTGATATALGEALDRIVAQARESGLTITPPAARQNEREISFSNPTEAEGLFKDLGKGRFARVRNGLEIPHLAPKTQQAELSALIGLRDTVLALLDEERQHREETWRMNELRVELNQRYDQYVAKYGPINRSKESEATGRRTYPGMGGFRKDPFWSSVKALETFNEETQEAKKFDIFRERVVRHPAPVGRASSPDDALVVTWDLHNEIRLDEVARLLGLETDEQAREALGTLVYDEPGTGRLIRKSEYLSGNVRRKLAAAEEAAKDDPRLAINVQALAAVVPRDLTAGEIEARLGSPWIDASYVQQFLCETLEDARIQISNLGARWSVKGGDRHSVLTRTVWGTDRRCAQDLAERLLNSQTIEVFDKSSDGSSSKNAEATAIAQAKAQQLDMRFRAWLWEDPDRADHLGRLYNDRFNSLVPQSFDGEQITAPGMSGPDLRAHQMAAIARIRNTPGVGLFHGTGAGKTLEMIVGGMELVRLGLVSKPAYVVPKKVVDQFAREFQQAYPLARVLAVDTEDLSGEKRRDFIATCANGNWDAVIISHNAFKSIPVNKKMVAEYLEHQKERLEQHLKGADDGDRYTVKDIEKQVANLEEKIKETLERSSDPGLEFEQTGIGYLFIDEAHVYKNLRVISSIQELALEGNQITSDLDLKLSYLRKTYGRRVVTLATATPVDNSPSEILTMTKYAAPQLLEEMGIDEDDQFHATFIQPRRRLEMTPDGSRFESRTRHARFVNLPELKRMMYSWADVKLKQHLDLGEPGIVGGGPEILSVPAASELREYLSDLAVRARAATGGKPPLRQTTKGELKQDNILWISTDGRLASLDLRLVGLHTDEPQKLDILANRMAEIWREHRDDVYYERDGTPESLRGSLQLVFCDLGVPGKDKWSFYEGLRDELVARGVPADKIRFAQDAKNRKQQDQLQRDANEGKIAVLIGSRAGLGTGVNVQRRVVAVVQADPTWKLTPLEQSLGRGKRQGNVNKEIHHIFAVTEGSYDPFLWQKVDDKARFTAQMLDPNDSTRTIDVQAEDDGRINPAVMFAVGAGKPELLQLYQLEETVGILKLEQKIWHNEQFTHEATINQYGRKVEQLRDERAQLDALMAQRVDTAGDAFAMIVAGRRFDRRAEAGLAVLDHLSDAAKQLPGRTYRRVEVGELGGFEVAAALDANRGKAGIITLGVREVPDGAFELVFEELADRDPTGLVRTLENRIAGIDRAHAKLSDQIERLEVNIGQAQARVGQPFPRQQELEEQSARFQELQKSLETLKAPERAAAASAPARATGRAELTGSGQAPDLPDPAEVARELRVTLERFRGALAELEADALTDGKLVEAAEAKSLREFAGKVMPRWVRDRLSDKRMANDAWQQQFIDAYYPSDSRLEGVRGDVDSYLIARVWVETHSEGPIKHGAVNDARSALARATEHEANGDADGAAALRRTAAVRRTELARLIEAEFEAEVGPPGPSLPTDGSRALRRKLFEFRSVVVELEAEALTDPLLMQAARVNSKDNFALVAPKWVTDTVVSRVASTEGWEPEFMRAYFDGDLKDQLPQYIVERVWHHSDGEPPEVGAGRGRDTPYREVIGDLRSAALDARAEHLRRLHAQRDAAEWRSERERAAFAFDELDHDAGRETWRLERTERRAIEATLSASTLADELVERGDHEAADVQRQVAAASRRELVGAIDAQWQQFEHGRHLSDWMAKNEHWAATVIAADRALAVEAEVAVDSPVAQSKVLSAAEVEMA